MSNRSIADLLKAAALVDSMTSQYGLIERARGLPEDYARSAERVSISADSFYSDSERPRIKKLAEQAKALVKAQETLRGEIERDALLAKYAAELESLRAVLPQIAARAAIELGDLARALKEEARGGAK